MDKCYYLEGKSFIIEDYDQQKPFASFLPGIAGLDGIPMWAYYTNRGQGIAGFGVENKDGSILDFVPANMSYRRTENAGFRTFIKKDGKVHELFTSLSKDEYKRKMIIDSNALGFVEENYTLDLRVRVKFFTTTSQSFPALIRKVSVESISGESHNIEIVDGLMTLWPYGTSDESIKKMSNLMTAWFDVINHENNLPFYKNRATTNDSAEIGLIEAGHFYGSFVEGSTEPLPIIYDSEVLFAMNTNNTYPVCFETLSTDELLKAEQVSANKIPCAFSVFKGEVSKSLSFNNIVGKMINVETLNHTAKIFTDEFFKGQELAGKELAEGLTNDVDGKTAYPVFDAYVKQSYFDNFLRGGYPIIFEGKEGPIVYHVYSRIHGDMEREYNKFLVEPAYFSQGIGNFRDVNQNRRNDVYVVPEAGRFNIKQFMEFLQLDGQNPLSIRGSELTIETEDLDEILSHVKSDVDNIRDIVSKPFTPGKLMTMIDDFKIELDLEKEAFLKLVLSKSSQEIKAAFGEGFWVDHWTYNMDLVDNFLNVYPDQLEDLMFNDQYRYFLSPAQVLPRKDKFVITSEGKIRQYDAVIESEERVEARDIDVKGTNWEKTKSGDILTTNLFEKLYNHVLNKVSNMDPSGIGIMMNTDKPGWNDAMNGLPGLFGSGTSEVVELRRIVSLLLSVADSSDGMSLPKEVVEFSKNYFAVLKAYNRSELDNQLLYERAQDLKEKFDLAISYGVLGDFECISRTETQESLLLIDERLNEAIERAKTIGQGILPSYFVHEAIEFVEVKDKFHPISGLQNVKVTKWQYRHLPFYLEAPARYMKQIHDPILAKPMYDKIKASGMYDEKLGMYVTSESLEEESMEIGRARAFVPGWLERESVFMHMEYKYLLGMLKSGLYTEFFDTIKTALPPFMDPAVYGRSTLENSSFIASSRNPNPDNHGRGFVSRLTGTTSELVTMWLSMMTGMKLFKIEDNKLVFELNPSLPSDFFDEDNQVACTIFGQTRVVYMNPDRKDTFGKKGVKVSQYILTYFGGEIKTLDKVEGQVAEDIRSKKVKEIKVKLS